MSKERVESRTILIPQFKGGKKSLAESINLLQKHLGNIYVDNECLQVKVWKGQSYICIAPKNPKKKINFDSFLFESMGSDGIVRDIRIRFKKEEDSIKSVFILIKKGADHDLMFEIFEAAPKGRVK